MDLTVRDVAAVFEVPESRIYRWIHDDDLPAREVNGQHFFNRAELLEWASIRRVRFSPNLFADGAEGETLLDALRLGGVLTGVPGGDKLAFLKEVVDRIALPADVDRSLLLELVLARESLGSTSVGGGIAIPHPRYPLVMSVARSRLSLCFPERPLDFGAADGQPVHTVFVLISPTIRAHLRMLARVACLLRDEPLRALLARRGAADDLMREIGRVEQTFGTAPAPRREPA